MLINRIAAYTHLSSTIYELLQDIDRKLQLFPTPLQFPLEFQKKSLDLRKLESWDTRQ